MGLGSSKTNPQKNTTEALEALIDKKILRKHHAKGVEAYNHLIRQAAYLLSVRRLGNKNVSITLDLPLTWPSTTYIAKSDEETRTVHHAEEASIQFREKPVSLIAELAAYASIVIGSPSLCSTLYMQSISSIKTICIDMRSIEAQSEFPIPHATSLWDCVNITRNGEIIYHGHFTLHRPIKSTQNTVYKQPLRVLLILPEKIMDEQWLASPFMDRNISQMDANLDVSIDNLGHTFYPRDINWKQSEASVDPMSIFYISLFLRVCCQIDQYPEFICLCKSPWLFTRALFKFNRYGLPRAIHDASETFTATQRWAFPVEIIPPTISWVDPRNAYSGSLFIGHPPDAEHLYLCAQYLNYFNINMVYVIGDRPPSLNLQEEILDMMDYWERITLHEMITLKNSLSEALYWRIVGGNRVMLMDITGGVMHSSSLAAYCVRKFFNLDCGSSAIYVRLRVPDANNDIIENYVMSDTVAQGNLQRMLNPSPSLYYGSSWHASSTFGEVIQSERMDQPDSGKRQVMIRKFRAEQKQMFENVTKQEIPVNEGDDRDKED